MYAANQTGAVWAVEHDFQAPAGVLLFEEEPTQQQLAESFIGYRQSFADALCASVDGAADAARLRAAGDALRAEEYQRTTTEARAFAAAGYPDDEVPRTVAAWMIGGRTAQEAADDILRKAAQFDDALCLIREIRLMKKADIRTQVAAGELAQASAIAASAPAGLQQALAEMEVE